MDTDDIKYKVVINLYEILDKKQILTILLLFAEPVAH